MTLRYLRNLSTITLALYFLTGVANVSFAEGLQKKACDVLGVSCVAVKPYQPSAASLEFISRIHEVGGKDNFDFLLYGNSQTIILVDGAPFAKYWQLKKDNQYVFHPMVYGRYIFENSNKPEFAGKLPELTEKVGSKMPGGEVAFYYPNNYPLNRMRGPDYAYSVISQSEILTGYLNYELQFPQESTRELTDAVRDAIFLPYEQGGVNLSNLALLEWPLFRSSPEIVLNGWLHALLRMNDYAHIRKDAFVTKFIEENLRFMLDNIGAWYDEERNISLYSDTTPFRVLLTPERKGQEIQVVFTPKDERLSAYSFAPVEDFDRQYSTYDTRILSRHPISGRMDIGVTCSRLFDTVFVSRAPFELSYKHHIYDPFRATPSADNKTTVLSSREEEGLWMVRLNSKSEGLMCGYPTNFAKADKKNHYHIQHIVALMYLAKAGVFENQELKAEMAALSLDWRKKTLDFKGVGIENFEKLQKMLDALNRGKVLKQFTNISEMGLGELGAP